MASLSSPTRAWQQTLALPIHDRSQAGQARRAVATWLAEHGGSDDLRGRVALIVTELGHNLALHTTGGSLLLRMLAGSPTGGVEVLAVDGGPGMANFQNCLRDGFSTAGTPGTGLGAVQRASQLFSALSQPGLGTVLLSQVWERGAGPAPVDRWSFSGINVAVPPEIECGDSWATQTVRPGTRRVLVADGLGHGPLAALAAQTAAEVFERNPNRSLTEVLELMHDALRSTRGAAVGLAELDGDRQQVTFLGVGNTAAAIVTPDKTTSLVSLNGTVGAQYRTLREFTYPWPAGATLVMTSDGLKTQWQLGRYPGLLERHVSLLAGVLYRDQLRGRDDATVVAIRQEK